MFESPLQRALSRFNSHQATEWDYANELANMADWLCAGPDRSRALLEATSALDTFRGSAVVKLWLHALVTFEVHLENEGCSHDPYLDSVVAGNPSRGPGNRRGLDGELRERMGVLDGLATLSDTYRCALLLKEGHGLSVTQTAQLMETSTASARSILYRARQTIRS